jgi:HEAT repeat protein
MHPLLQRLQGGDRRSIGKSREVVNRVLADPELFGIVFGGMTDDDPLVRMRSADAAEKIAALRPDLLQSYKRRLLREVAPIEQQEVRWHVAQLISRIKLSRTERRIAVEILSRYLKDDSRIVRTFALQGLADLAVQDAYLRPGIVRTLKRLTRTGSPAMRSRGRKLLQKLDTKKEKEIALRRKRIL